MTIKQVREFAADLRFFVTYHLLPCVPNHVIEEVKALGFDPTELSRMAWITTIDRTLRLVQHVAGTTSLALLLISEIGSELLRPISGVALLRLRISDIVAAIEAAQRNFPIATQTGTILVFLSSALASLAFRVYFRLGSFFLASLAELRLLEVLIGMYFESPEPLDASQYQSLYRPEKMSARLQASEMRKMRRRMHLLASNCDHVISLLAGRSYFESAPATHQSLPHMILWFTERPWDETRRRKLINACFVYARALRAERVLIPLNLQLEATEIGSVVAPPRSILLIRVVLFFRDRVFLISLVAAALVLILDKAFDVLTK